MNTETVEILCKINNDFYQKHCSSFSATRTAPWTGWKISLELVRDTDGVNWQDFSVFDLACGNLRFESFLATELPQASIALYAVDNCDDLVPLSRSVQYQNLDIMNALRNGGGLGILSSIPACDLSVSFGFMHHVPSQLFREEVLSSLINQTKPGGFVIVSFWQFLNNEAMGKKALITHRRALKELELQPLDENDYLLGWKDIPGEYRYCHSFSDAEIDQLIHSAAKSADLLARFVSDGRTDNLNTYLVLRVRK